MAAFWDIALRSLVQVNRRFRGARCIHKAEKRLHGPISQKDVILIFAAVRT
jgi:hypothetical protein